MKIQRLLGCYFVITAAALSASAQTERAPQRIVFARGATVARASGYLRGNRDSAWFVLRASAGQHMRVSINARDATHGTVISPTGRQETQPGGVVFDDDLSETGDYKIGVSESPMANAWRGNFTVVVEILPRGQSTRQTSLLEHYVGKYPNELFRGVPSVKTRLRQLLGANYKAFTDRMQVETPIEKDGDTIVMRGCMAHSCTIEEAILVINLNDGRPYVALRTNSKFSRTFPANRSELPAALKRAMAWKP